MQRFLAMLPLALLLPWPGVFQPDITKKTYPIASVMILSSEGIVSGEPSEKPVIGARVLVAGLSFDRFKRNIQALSCCGDRSQLATEGSTSYTRAANWLRSQLAGEGYRIEEDAFQFQGQTRTSIYVTKLGTTAPDQMYLVSAHLDGRGGGGAADDDASGVSLVLEVARAFALPGVQTEKSIRFVFWNNEESGLHGSKAYVSRRAPLQGIEHPPGSRLFPEPRWLGIVQHDMILYDHGLPPQAHQIRGADIDIEYRAGSAAASHSLALADALQRGATTYGSLYRAEIGANMQNTDSVSFENFTAAVSVRENRRGAEIGNGSNPNYHRSTDVFSSYSENDFQLGFSALKMTLGTVAELAGTTINP